MGDPTDDEDIVRTRAGSTTPRAAMQLALGGRPSAAAIEEERDHQTISLAAEGYLAARERAQAMPRAEYREAVRAWDHARSWASAARDAAVRLGDASAGVWKEREREAGERGLLSLLMGVGVLQLDKRAPRFEGPTERVTYKEAAAMLGLGAHKAQALRERIRNADDDNPLSLLRKHKAGNKLRRDVVEFVHAAYGASIAQAHEAARSTKRRTAAAAVAPFVDRHGAALRRALRA